MGRFFIVRFSSVGAVADGDMNRFQSCQPCRCWQILHAVAMGAWGPWGRGRAVLPSPWRGFVRPRSSRDEV